MGYRSIDLDLVAPGTPPVLPTVSMPALGGLEPEGPHLAQLALDTLPTSGQRVLLELGIQGGDAQLVLDGTDPTQASGDRLYPDNTTQRTAGRARADLTPGCIVGLQVLAFPSGPTQQTDGDAGWEPSGAGGVVRCTAVYYDSTGASISASLDLMPAASQQPFARVPTPAMPSIQELYGVVSPWGPNPSVAALEPYLRGGTTAVIKVDYVGSVRPVDVAVVEHPLRAVVDTTDSEWPLGMYGNADPYEELPSEWPIVQLDTDDPGGGTEAIRRALDQAGKKFGPALVRWSSGTEHANDLLEWISYDGGTGDDEAPPVSGSGTTPLTLPYGITYDAQLPAWSLGHYARHVEHGDEFYDGRTGVLPVWVAVYAKIAAGTVTIQQGGDEWSSIDVSIATGGGYTWTVVPGWIEAGLGPEDAPRCRALVTETGAGGWDLRDVAVYMRHR